MEAGNKHHRCLFPSCRANSRAGRPPAPGLIIPQQRGVNSCARAGEAETPQHTSSCGVCRNVTPRSRGPTHQGWTEPTGGPQTLKKLQNDPKGACFPRQHRRGDGLTPSPQREEQLVSRDTGTELQPPVLAGVCFLVPRIQHLPQGVRSHPSCSQGRQGDSPRCVPQSDPKLLSSHSRTLAPSRWLCQPTCMMPS